MRSASPRASIVIPAHNESGVIARCLTTLIAGAEPGEFEVVVVCNGCTDDTASAADSISNDVNVIETPTAGKAHALNLGDRNATVYPRIYLDADVDVSAPTIRAVARHLESGAALAAAPVLAVHLEGASRAVRAYYRIWVRLRYARDNLVGAGFYGLSEAGRQRFERFPDIIADDLFVRSHFQPHERATVPDGQFVIRAPRDLASLIAVKSRRMLGNIEMPRALGVTPVEEPQGLAHLVKRRPGLTPSAVVYAYVQAAAKLSARWRMTFGRFEWTRDLTSRRQHGSTRPGVASR